MRALPSLLGILATLLACPCGVHAQSTRGYALRIDAPDCRLAALSSDNFIGDGRFGTIRARRWQLQAISVSTAVVASLAVHKLFHVRPAAAAFFGGVGVGVLPHLRSQVLQRRTPISVTDDAADLAERMVPFLVVQGVVAGHRDPSWTGRVATAFSVAATVLGASCFASP